jgi:sarcosine oxidase subunit beta
MAVHKPPRLGLDGAMRSALILGGGIMGLSTAWALWRAGWRVTVLDQDALPNPRGASVDEHRLIRHAYGAQTGYMRMVDDAYAAWELLWRELGESLYVETGTLAIASGREGWCAESGAALAAEGRAFDRLSPQQATARFPWLDFADVAEILHIPTGGVLLAGRIVGALAQHLAAAGVNFERGVAVAADPERATLRLADGRTLSAERLVLAAGPWAPRLLPEVAREVTASRQVVVYLDAPEAHAAAWRSAPMVLDIAPDAGFYAVPPVAGTGLKIGDHRFSMQGDAEADPRQPSRAEAEAILAFARARLRDADAYAIREARICFYDVRGGERFWATPLGARGLLLSGFTGHGFKFGALLGLAAAAALADDTLLAALPDWAAGEAPPPRGLLHAIERTTA